MRTITLNPKQQREVEILTRLEAGALDVATAAELLGVGARQVRRLRARFRQEGMAAVIHGNRGRAPANRTDPALVERIVALAGPAGQVPRSERLSPAGAAGAGGADRDRPLDPRSPAQAGWRAAGAPSRRPPVHRRRRLRRSAEGMLLQIDGSPFDWLEERGPKAALIGAIDDATGKILFLLFRPTEDQVGYLLLLRSIAQRYGLPMSIYHDRHTILRSPKQPTLEEQLAGQTPMSQIQRIMAELGIESIPAYSPQAKGRIERLWGTLQDRLTKELRLAGITTLEQANAFLPGFIERYNARFAKPPPTPTAPGCRCPPTWTRTTTSPSARPARCAPITASASPASSCNCCPDPRTPAWSPSASPSTSRRRRHLPVSWQTPIGLPSGGGPSRRPHAQPRRPWNRRCARAQPSNAPGSSGSPNMHRGAGSLICATLPAPGLACRRSRGNAGERPRAPPQGQCRGGRAPCSASRHACPHTLAQSAKPSQRTTPTTSRKWTFSLSN